MNWAPSPSPVLWVPIPVEGKCFVMSHAATGMMRTWDPTKRFSKIITGIEDPRMMLHDENFVLVPLLDGKMLDVNVPSTGSRTLLIDHMESSHIVNE